MTLAIIRSTPRIISLHDPRKSLLKKLHAELRVAGAIGRLATITVDRGCVPHIRVAATFRDWRLALHFGEPVTLALAATDSAALAELEECWREIPPMRECRLALIAHSIADASRALVAFRYDDRVAPILASLEPADYLITALVAQALFDGPFDVTMRTLQNRWGAVATRLVYQVVATAFGDSSTESLAASLSMHRATLGAQLRAEGVRSASNVVRGCRVAHALIRMRTAPISAARLAHEVGLADQRALVFAIQSVTNQSMSELAHSDRLDPSIAGRSGLLADVLPAITRSVLLQREPE